MNLRSVLIIALVFFTLNVNARVILPAYTLRGIAYSKNHEPMRNQKLFVTKRGQEFEIMTDSVGNYMITIYGSPNPKGILNSKRIKIRFGEKTISVRDQSKKYHRKRIYTKEKDLQF